MAEVQLEVGSVSVLLGHPQWAYSDVVDYVEQVELVGPHIFRRPWGLAQSAVVELRFAKTNAIMEALRIVSHTAGRTGERVKYIPDASDPGTFQWVDWQEGIAFTRVIENREEVVLALVEQVP